MDGDELAAAEKHLTGMILRAYFLARYTGQRGSDVVKLAKHSLMTAGSVFDSKRPEKNGDIWCPIEEPLAAEMATWERLPGPYVRQNHGKLTARPYSTNTSSEARERIPELADVTFHGLRATRVVELRQRGATTLEIQDQVGMSPKMIDRYCCFADKEANGKAAVVALAERRKNAGL